MTTGGSVESGLDGGKVSRITAEQTGAANKKSKAGPQAKATVWLLSDQDAEFSIPKSALGQELFDRVCHFVQLQEREYFGIQFLDSDNEKSWLKMGKSIKQQLKSGVWNFEFLVQFYPTKPEELKDDITRYYLCMQVHRDLVTERLPASISTSVFLGSLMVQSELGDYDRMLHPGNYVGAIPLAPQRKQTAQLEEKVMELHREKTSGMSPAEAHLMYLSTAKRQVFYGVYLHKATDKDSTTVEIGISGSGVDIFRESLRINRFIWPKVLKLSYRRNTFFLKTSKQTEEGREQELAFRCSNKKAAKRLWKEAVAHHSFLRNQNNEKAGDQDTLRHPRLGIRTKNTTTTTTSISATIEKVGGTDDWNSKLQRGWSKRNQHGVSIHGVSRNDNHTLGHVSADGAASPVDERSTGNEEDYEEYSPGDTRTDVRNNRKSATNSRAEPLKDPYWEQEARRRELEEAERLRVEEQRRNALNRLTPSYRPALSSESSISSSVSSSIESIDIDGPTKGPSGLRPDGKSKDPFSMDSTTITTRHIDFPNIPSHNPTDDTRWKRDDPNWEIGKPEVYVTGGSVTIRKTTTTIEVDGNGQGRKQVQERIAVLADSPEDEDRALREAILCATGGLNHNVEVEKLEMDEDDM